MQQHTKALDPSPSAPLEPICTHVYRIPKDRLNNVLLRWIKDCQTTSRDYQNTCPLTGDARIVKSTKHDNEMFPHRHPTVFLFHRSSQRQPDMKKGCSPMARPCARSYFGLDAVPYMRPYVETPKVSVVVETILMQ